MLLICKHNRQNIVHIVPASKSTCLQLYKCLITPIYCTYYFITNIFKYASILRMRNCVISRYSITAAQCTVHSTCRCILYISIQPMCYFVRVSYLRRGGPHISGVSSQVTHKWMGILPRVCETPGLCVLNNRYYRAIVQYYSNMSILYSNMSMEYTLYSYNLYNVHA